METEKGVMMITLSVICVSFFFFFFRYFLRLTPAMASKAEAEKVRLVCPMCLDNFKNATILNCGHTFCMECLEEYDEQHNDLDHIVCPVCRQSTKLGPRRVSGLIPNFSVKGVEDKLNVDHVDIGGQKPSYCTLHSTVYKDIFCVDCGIFICLTCYFDTHKDHKVIKKEEVGKNLREKRDTCIKKSKMTKSRIEKCLNDGKEKDKDIHRHLNNMEKDIKDTFARKVTILQENEKLLLKRVDDIRKDSDKQSKRYMTHHRQLIDNINNSITLLTENVSESSDSNTLQAYHLQYREIDNSLKQTIDNKSMVHLKQAAESTRFCPADEKLLALGHIEQEVKATGSSMKHANTSTGVRQNVGELQGSSKITEIPAAVTHYLKIVREVELLQNLEGLAALSHDAVVVGYGVNREGADCFFVSGYKKPYLRSKVGSVNDITLLSDGKSVVSHDDDTCLVYNKQGKQIRGMTYTCTEGSIFPQLCNDQHDNIYAVNGTSEVFIFHGNNMKPKRVVPTFNIKPEEICVTKTGVMITNSNKPRTVAVFDREGHVGTTITASDNEEYLYAAVDSQDRVLIARVRWWSNTIGLTRYTLHGTTLTEEVTFNPLILHEPCGLSYMVSLTPNMIAYAHSYRLYFISITA